MLSLKEPYLNVAKYHWLSVVVGNICHTHVAYASVTAMAVVKLGTKMAPKQLLCVTPPHFLTPTLLASAHSLSLSLCARSHPNPDVRKRRNGS